MESEAGSETLADMFARRLIFVMGKGGVGKTTLAIAAAYAAQALGKRVLLAETEENRSISRFFNQQELGEIPVRVSDNIRIARVHPKSELETYTHTNIKSRFLSRRITRSRLFDYLAEATPGLKEVMTLGRIWRWEAARDPNGRYIYDTVIVDAPATGHGLGLLRLPKLLIEMIRIGPVAAQIRDLQAVLADEKITWLCLVTQPEELSVKESLALMDTARDDVGIPVRSLFLNGVYPALFTPAQADKIAAVTEQGRAGQALRSRFSDPEGLDSVLRAAVHQSIRQRIHQGYQKQLGEDAACPVIPIPYYFTNQLTFEDMESIAAMLQPPEKNERNGRDAGNDR
ncbi:MAG: ArsA family ATPase [Thermodesulfobacteriota bacterium]